ncbi:helix-turn-helix transcriptional regulator [Streptomyces sp. NPDC014894]|uniref:helix-turn-helix transcriptional regulator n=1 Tax=Streptomyces sp. NPDC014894 TaxID=3364931 RepID=UPI0036FD611A
MTDESGAAELPRRVAARLNLLFDVIQPAALQRPWSSAEVADRAGVDTAYVDGLRAATLSPDEIDPGIGEKQRERLFAQRLECLFRTRLSPRTGKRVTQTEVAEALKSNKQHVGNLRAGKNNPSIVLAQKYADYFNVDVGYFSAAPLSAVAACFGHSRDFLVRHDDDPYVVHATANLRLLRAMADKRVRHVVGRLVDRYEAASGESPDDDAPDHDAPGDSPGVGAPGDTAGGSPGGRPVGTSWGGAPPGGGG